jgi:hypothetical protein
MPLHPSSEVILAAFEFGGEPYATMMREIRAGEHGEWDDAPSQATQDAFEKAFREAELTPHSLATCPKCRMFYLLKAGKLAQEAKRSK